MVTIFQQPTNEEPTVVFSHTAQETDCYCAVCDVDGTVRSEHVAPFIEGYATFDFAGVLPLSVPSVPMGWYGIAEGWSTAYKLAYGTVGGATVYSATYIVHNSLHYGVLHAPQDQSQRQYTMDWLFFRPTVDISVFREMKAEKRNGVTVSVFMDWTPIALLSGKTYAFRCDYGLLRLGLVNSVEDAVRYHFRLFRADGAILGHRSFDTLDFFAGYTLFIINEFGGMEALHLRGKTSEIRQQNTVQYSIETTFLSPSEQTRLLNVWKPNLWIVLNSLIPVRCNVTELEIETWNKTFKLTFFAL